jgi:hypothetical protein
MDSHIGPLLPESFGFYTMMRNQGAFLECLRYNSYTFCNPSSRTEKEWKNWLDLVVKDEELVELLELVVKHEDLVEDHGLLF